jgi:hypothetical protein
MTTTTDIGYAKNKQYASGVSSNQPRRHSVIKDDRGLWVTRCNGKAATREYKGWATEDSITCQKCLKKINEEEQ